MSDTHKYVGNIYKTNNCGDVKVLSCEKYSKAVVIFLQTGNVVTTSMSVVKLGQIRDKSLNSIVGGCSLGETKSKVNGAYKKSYMLWTNMVSRCYRGNETTKNQHTKSVKFLSYLKSMRILRNGVLIKLVLVHWMIKVNLFT